ncbi:MAG: homocysteine S-methyltransferase family protein [Candidatus Thorarchaeota archaeon]
MSFQDWLKNDSKILLFDGGMGTEIFKKGISPGKLPDLINLESPDVITDIHKSYYVAGADMCQTNTFGASLLNLKNYKVENKIQEINKSALKIIRKACPPNKFIIGDIGPSGAFKPPVGKATYDDWKSSYKEQAKYLEGGVDGWHIETISDIDEMLAAIEAIKEVSRKPIISSMTYKKTKKGFFTIMGHSLDKCVKMLENANISVIGANCTLGSGEMVELAMELTKLTEFPFSVKPNAGKPRLDENQIVHYDQPISDFVKDIKEMISWGAKIVGGCCGTTPETIKEIRRLLTVLKR